MSLQHNDYTLLFLVFVSIPHYIVYPSVVHNTCTVYRVVTSFSIYGSKVGGRGNEAESRISPDKVSNWVQSPRW